jgi:hypothetical protein
MRKVLRRTRDLVLGILMLPMVSLMSLMAQTTTPPPQTFTTTIYLDYRYFLSNAGPVTIKPSSDTTAYLNNQFVFRRAYFYSRTNQRQSQFASASTRTTPPT